MSNLRLRVISLRYSSWSMRPWLVLTHAGAEFATETVDGQITMKLIQDQWQDILRLLMSIKTGTVTASFSLRKLAAYPRQNGLAQALRILTGSIVD